MNCSRHAQLLCSNHLLQVVVLVTIVLIGNTLLNGIILRLLGYRWRECLYAGALLAQIGEFSFVLAAVGLSNGIINEVAYQYTIATIALSLLVSPFWILGARRVLGVATIAGLKPLAPAEKQPLPNTNH